MINTDIRAITYYSFPVVTRSNRSATIYFSEDSPKRSIEYIRNLGVLQERYYSHYNDLDAIFCITSFCALVSLVSLIIFMLLPLLSSTICLTIISAVVYVKKNKVWSQYNELLFDR